MNPLSLLWKDKMDIYRFIETEVDNITQSGEHLLYGGIPCKYSKDSLTSPGQEVPKLVSKHTLFCDIGTDLQEGDKIIVTQKNGNKVTLSVGEGFPFTNHMEFEVKRSDTI